MRVLHFFKTALPETMGGIEQVIDQIARGSGRYGVESEVLALTCQNDALRSLSFNGYTLHRARQDFQLASTGFSASVFFRFAKLAKRADVIHYHFPWPFMDIVHFATKVNKPSIVTYHSDIIRQRNLLRFYRPLKRRFLADADRIVATSQNYLATSDALNRFSEKVSVIPIGLDKDTYPKPSDECLEYWRGRLGEHFFLFIGVLRYYKGLHVLMEANAGLNYPIVIVGAGPIEGELKADAVRLGLTNVIFTGALPEKDKVALLTLCHGVVFPSHLRSEAFGISLLEGAMFGKPMISSEIGTGTSFINISGETGLVVPPSDPSLLRQAMRHLWEHPEQAAEMGRHAEERYWRHFTAERMVKSYVDLYNDLIVTSDN